MSESSTSTEEPPAEAKDAPTASAKKEPEVNKTDDGKVEELAPKVVTFKIGAISKVNEDADEQMEGKKVDFTSPGGRLLEKFLRVFGFAIEMRVVDSKDVPSLKERLDREEQDGNARVLDARARWKVEANKISSEKS